MSENHLIVVHAFATEMEAVIARGALEAFLVRPPILYVDHIESSGLDLFEAACSQDLEGIVAKLASGHYEPESTTWVKIKNRSYSQTDGRDDFFDERAASSR
jgi:ATP-dependent DNA ligase